VEDHENALSNHPTSPTNIIIKVIGVLRRTLKGVFDKAPTEELTQRSATRRAALLKKLNLPT
jgi:hypothetical protein